MSRAGASLLVALVALVAVACGDGGLAAPRVLAVDPPALSANELRTVAVRTEAALPVRVDYGASAMALDAQVAVRFGATPAGTFPVDDEGVVQAEVPQTLAPGFYDVHVDWPDGRSGVLAGGFQVTPASAITGLVLQPIGDQVQGVPFDVVLSVLGPDAASFQGTVALTLNKGALSPARTGPFVAGQRTERVTVDQPNANLVLTATDALGHAVDSNPFRVTPR